MKDIHDKPTKSRVSYQLHRIRVILALAILIFFSTIESAIAHHPMGGKIPSSLWEGFLSGVGHPIIGIDHLAFVVAVGLIAVGIPNGISIIASFLATVILGTGIHLLSIDLPLTEIAIALSVVVFGAMLALKKKLSLQLLSIFAAIAGIFHGYAYGEAIIGAEITPLFAYLLSFTVVQLLIALLVMKSAELVSNFWENKFFLVMRFLGLAIGAIGMVFFTSAIFS
ncbi:MAG: HupE/UreJ family protein [Okeania sp. SIO2G4]|uniref:HupE/UreJ family protein n=1 Tax=unclassified Okeania TaxID=2634635 RepID=UPI0013BD0CF1|nr:MULTISPECIES: HupE/UreJ family protein [unclassified Okeania]NEP06369.1 HupE/UreJ family protein [Okeania sp. SIO4D6]NEP74285.1 HupE/UreJ family protein [Okeania sp. SIO2G5]NEP95284.1 HupE/UreJ family protein [Okeania sp. SIO2F5]NEQ93008.1 HupE/UreJ family protein [Okeania sp. SIO2G4]